MEQSFARHAARSVPRYTSYPTAPHFTDRIDPGLYSQWLGELPRETTLSLYLHVPFCRALCHYCGCHTRAVQRDEPVAVYARYLSRELELVLESLGPGRPLLHIHWGGGTPSLLPETDFLDIVQQLRRGFAVTEAAEHAIELDPRYVTRAFVERLRRGGVTRVNLGVQDFDPRVQAAIGRVQPFARVSEAVALLRTAGLAAIGFDLMYGLPHQNRAGVVASVEKAVSLQPDRIALFGYAHVPWMKKHQRLIDPASLPGVLERLAQSEAAAQALVGHGYCHIGIDHFARPHDGLAEAARTGRLHRNFQGYTADPADALIGIGTSSIGRLPTAFVQNASDEGSWRRAIEAGHLPVTRGKILGAEELARGEIINRLMCEMRVDVAAVAARHGLSAACLSDALQILERFEEEGLVRIQGFCVTVPEAKRPFLRVVASAFDSYLDTATTRHSVAV